MARSWTSAEVDKPRQETAGIGIKEVTPPRETVTVASPKATSSEDECWIYMHMHDTGIGGDDVRSILLDNWRGKDLLFDIVQWRKGDEYAADLMASRYAFRGCRKTMVCPTFEKIAPPLHGSTPSFGRRTVACSNTRRLSFLSSVQELSAFKTQRNGSSQTEIRHNIRPKIAETEGTVEMTRILFEYQQPFLLMR